MDEKRGFCGSGWFARRNQIRRESFLRRRRDPDLGGPKTVVSQPAATSNIRGANSNTYEPCGNNPFEPPPVFNKLAATGLAIGTAVGLGRYSDASGSRSVNTGVFIGNNLAIRRHYFRSARDPGTIAKVTRRSHTSCLRGFCNSMWELDSYERERAARITSKKPNGPRRQLAVTTPPINAPMMPSNAASVPVRYRFPIGVRGPSHA